MRGGVDYCVRGREPLFGYYEAAPPGSASSNLQYHRHGVDLSDVRSLAPSLSLDRQGYKFVRLEDGAIAARLDMPALAEMVRRETGGVSVTIFDQVERKHVPGLEDSLEPGSPRQPVRRVHADFTPWSAAAAAQALGVTTTGRRYSIINIWRPTRGPVRDMPLAVCDAESVDENDAMPCRFHSPTMPIEIYLSAHNPGHRWYFAPDMQTNELWLIKSFDSAPRMARFAFHAAAEITSETSLAPAARSSVENRALVLF